MSLDEIFSLRLQTKSNPLFNLPKCRSHRAAISSTLGGFIPAKADLIEKRTREVSFFHICERATKRIQNPNGFILQNRFTFDRKWFQI